jgi:hypothetical protein
MSADPSQKRRTSPMLVVVFVAVALVALGALAWAMMPMFGPMPGMTH